MILTANILFMLFTALALHCCFKKDLMWTIIFIILAGTQLIHYKTGTIIENQEIIINLIKGK